jgi:hypothetical protein
MYISRFYSFYGAILDLHREILFHLSLIVSDAAASGRRVVVVAWCYTKNTSTVQSTVGSQGRSVSIVSDYELEDRTTGRSRYDPPAGANDFSSSLCVQTGSGAHPASCTMGTRDPFLGAISRPGRDADHSPHLVPRS